MQRAHPRTRIRDIAPTALCVVLLLWGIRSAAGAVRCATAWRTAPLHGFFQPLRRPSVSLRPEATESVQDRRLRRMRDALGTSGTEREPGLSNER